METALAEKNTTDAGVRANQACLCYAERQGRKL